METVVMIIGIVLRIVGAIVCSNKAGELNRNEGSWGFLGFMMPIVAMIIVHCLKTKIEWHEEILSEPSYQQEDTVILKQENLNETQKENNPSQVEEDIISDNKEIIKANQYVEYLEMKQKFDNSTVLDNQTFYEMPDGKIFNKTENNFVEDSKFINVIKEKINKKKEQLTYGQQNVYQKVQNINDTVLPQKYINLRVLKGFLDDGIITKEEFKREKRKILESNLK